MSLIVHTAEDSAWQRLLSVPHRGYFGAGVLAILSLAAWWSSLMMHPANNAYPPMLVHALMMPLGIFPLFMLGFIFTAGPKWLNVTAPGGNLPLAAGYLLGVLLSLAGFAAGGSWPALGLLTMQLIWSVAALKWLACIRQSKAADKYHAICLMIAMTMGAVTLMLALLWVRSGDGMLWMAARSFSLWAFLLPVFLTVSHRMIPFFTQSALPAIAAWRPKALLNLWLAGCLLLAISCTWDMPLTGAAIAFLLSISLAYTSWRWGLRASLGNRLLAMLHLSFAWLSPALALEGLSLLGVQVGAAPAHAIALGFCCTMLVGFVTRVTLGHGGRALSADNTYWAIYLGLHGVAVVRVAVALAILPTAMLHIASGIWLVLLLAWAARVLPIYWRPRLDGKPG